MLKLFVIFVLVAASAAALSAQGPDLSFEGDARPHPGIDAVYAKFSKAYRELDHELVGGSYTVDAAYLVPDQDLITGRAKITPTFKGFFDHVRGQKGALSISFRIVQRKVSGDLAYDVGYFTLTQTDSAGKSSTGRGKFVVVAVREKNGEWCFQVDGYSDLSKPGNR